MNPMYQDRSLRSDWVVWNYPLAFGQSWFDELSATTPRATLTTVESYSRTASIWPEATLSPAVTRISATRAGRGDLSSFCIFMASMTMMP